MTYAERNVANAFEFAQKLVQVKDVQDLVKLQTEFIQSQMQAMTEQGEGSERDRHEGRHGRGQRGRRIARRRRDVFLIASGPRLLVAAPLGMPASRFVRIELFSATRPHRSCGHRRALSSLLRSASLL
ncbi:MAG: phasin family protein [Rhodoplanes sp.]